MRSRLVLLLALARGVELLLLDEPTEGLDPAVIEVTLQALVSLVADQGTTVFFASHQLAHVEQIADHVCIVEQGWIVVSESLDELTASYRRCAWCSTARRRRRLRGARRDGAPVAPGLPERGRDRGPGEGHERALRRRAAGDPQGRLPRELERSAAMSAVDKAVWYKS
jgi:ABC-type multidrug transport system ATPase subunit